MSSRANAEALATDPANDLFWRFDMRRLTAEEIRDSILAVSGDAEPRRCTARASTPRSPPRCWPASRCPGHGWGKSPPEEQAPAERLRPRQAVAAAADPRELRRRRDRPLELPGPVRDDRSRRRRWRCSTASSSTSRPRSLADRLQTRGRRRPGRAGRAGAPRWPPAATPDGRRGRARRRPDRRRCRPRTG